MNKTEIVKELDKFPYSKEDYWVLTGGAMVLYGIKEQTSDIDLDNLLKVFNDPELTEFQYLVEGDTWTISIK